MFEIYLNTTSFKEEMTMAKTLKDTLHYQSSKNQRGLTTGMMDLVAQFGEEVNDGKVVLTGKTAELMISHLNKLKEDLMRLAKRGGAVLVTQDGTNITAYGLENYKHC